MLIVFSHYQETVKKIHLDRKSDNQKEVVLLGIQILPTTHITLAEIKLSRKEKYVFGCLTKLFLMFN